MPQGEMVMASQAQMSHDTQSTRERQTIPSTVFATVQLAFGLSVGA